MPNPQLRKLRQLIHNPGAQTTPTHPLQNVIPQPFTGLWHTAVFTLHHSLSCQFISHLHRHLNFDSELARLTMTIPTRAMHDCNIVGTQQPPPLDQTTHPLHQPAHAVQRRSWPTHSQPWCSELLMHAEKGFLLMQQGRASHASEKGFSWMQRRASHARSLTAAVKFQLSVHCCG